MNGYLPSEIYEYIMYNLSIKDIMSCSQTNSLLRDICDNELFWHKIFHREYNINYDKPLKSSWKETVLKFSKVANEPILTDRSVRWRIDYRPGDLKYSEKEYIGPLKIIVPATRIHWCKIDYETLIISKSQLDGVVTIADILQTVYEYYQQPLTLEQLSKYHHRGDDNSYVIKAEIALEEGHTRKHLDIMGHKVYFAGLVKHNDTFRLLLM